MNRKDFDLLSLDGKVAALADSVFGSAAASPATDTTPAYERPEMRPDDSRLVADGQTRNPDGSMWYTARLPTTGDPSLVKEQYGYISPKKCPALWELAKAVLGVDFEARFNAPWHADPYQIYAGNPAVLLEQGYAMPGQGKESGKGDREEINFMMFTQMLQPTGISVRM